MVNRFKRRSVLITFFSIQFILLSTYTFLYYQNGSTDVQITTTESSSSVSHDIVLPADLIEKSNRSTLDGNYRDPKLSKSQLKENLPSHGDLQLLNVSFVTDSAQEKIIVQCPLLSTHLGNTLCD